MTLKISLDALTVLDEIDNAGSFSGAAKALHRVPTSITYAVRKLEDELNIEIFDRSGYRAELTEAGKELLREGRNILRAAQELEDRSRQIANGWEPEVRIVLDEMLPTHGLTELLAEFDNIGGHTGVTIGREAHGGTLDALIWGRADIVIGALGSSSPGNNLGNNFSILPIGELKLQLTAALGHPLCGEIGKLSNESLRHHRAISITDTARQLTSRPAGILAGQDNLGVASLSDLISSVQRGLGVGYIPADLAERLQRDDRLSLLQTKEEAPSIPMHIAWNADVKGKATRWFLRRLKRDSVRNQLLRYPN